MELIITELPSSFSHKTICLNMIVKNEAAIIADTLQNLCSYINFAYWVICDTGSTDQTKEIICDFFEKKGIKGELIEHEWRDFAYNRTKALDCAFNKTDYLFIFDADDRIVGNFRLPLPQTMNKDGYELKFGNTFWYNRQLLITNRKKWCFKGVLHEYLTGIDNMNNGSEIIEGDYYIISGKFGNRSQNPNKYLDDAIVLKNAFKQEMNVIEKGHIEQGHIEQADTGLAHRYAFYCAQSYKDANRPTDAIEWYKKVLELNNWAQEKYYSCLMIGNLYKNMNEDDNAIRYWLKSSVYDNERIEGIVNAMECLRNKGEHLMVTFLYHKYKNYNKNVSDNKLFIESSKYKDFLEYNNSISAYYVANEKQSGYDCCKKIILNNIIGDLYLNSTISNVMFYKEFIEKDEDRTLYNRFFFKDEKIILNPRFSKEECKKSKSILFYTGYANEKWNYSYMKNNALGGSEKAVAYLSHFFPKDYHIYISGGVENEKMVNITYLHLNELQELINNTPFHTIICSRYIAFLEMFKDVSFYQYYIWAHDTKLLSYGCNLTDSQIISKWNNSIDGCICQTRWHAELYKNYYPELKDKIKIINNGINYNLLSSYNEESKNKKITNRFIYTSCSERGLIKIVKLWSKIVDILPNATLIISSYNTFPSESNEDKEIKEIINTYPNSITHLGKLSTEQLYKEMSNAEYWLYPTSWHETSCITAMEMLATGVICIYYPIAGLIDTIKEYGVSVNNENEILDKLMMLSNNNNNIIKNDLRMNGIKYALSCSWENRAKEWSRLLLIDNENNIKSNENNIKIINLKRRQDRKQHMQQQFIKENITNYEFIEAVDGKELTPTLELQQLFTENNFNYRKGVMGCALSHYNLWRKLLEDNTHDYYIIFEDDINLHNEPETNTFQFKERFNKLTTEFEKNDLLLLGYSMFNERRNEVKHIYDTINHDTILKIEPFNKNLYIGGAFAYSINKLGAKKLIDYIYSNGIKCAIDNIITLTPNLNICEIQPLIVRTNWNENYDPCFDTDIQTNFDVLDFTQI